MVVEEGKSLKPDSLRWNPLLLLSFLPLLQPLPLPLQVPWLSHPASARDKGLLFSLEQWQRARGTLGMWDRRRSPVAEEDGSSTPWSHLNWLQTRDPGGQLSLQCIETSCFLYLQSFLWKKEKKKKCLKINQKILCSWRRSCCKPKAKLEGESGSS